MSLLEQTELIYQEGEKTGLGDEDMIALYKLIHRG
jgi:hypothetical protein